MPTDEEPAALALSRTQRRLFSGHWAVRTHRRKLAQRVQRVMARLGEAVGGHLAVVWLDNYSKWRTREGIKNLPELGDPPGAD